MKREEQRLGNYRLLRLLGRGGFSQVYLGEHVYLKSQVAIKLLKAQSDNSNFEVFLKEARMIASLEHPHIIRVLDFGIEESTPFLVMDYAPHGTLRHFYRPGTQISPQNILPYVKQAATALQYAHEKKLIHRDVKPENMLLGMNSELLMSDFGIAAMTNSSHYQSTLDVVGTCAYMAPEQFKGKPRPTSDQYALGIVVYEWLCGEQPFRGSFLEVASQHIFATPPPLREKVPALSPDVEAVVLTALAKEPQQRFASMLDFADALARACHPRHAQLFVRSPTPQQDQSLNPDRADTSLDPAYAATALAKVPSMLHKKPRPRLPRRIFLAGLVAVSGGIVWFAYSQKFLPFLPRVRPTADTLAPGTLIYIYHNHSDSVNALGWSPDGKHIASVSADQTVQVWNYNTGKYVTILRGHTASVNGVAWSPDGMRIASASADQTVRVCNAISNGSVLTTYRHDRAVYAVAWSPKDANLFASGGEDGKVRIWRVSTGETIHTYQGHGGYAVLAVAWSPEGNQIASAGTDQSVQVWDTTTEENIYTYRSHRGDVRSVAWSPNGQYLASGSSDQSVQVWEPTTGVSLFAYHHIAPVNAVAWSPNGQYLASGSFDHTVQVWQA